MNDNPPQSEVRFIASARNDLMTFPEKVRRQMGRALNRVQHGETPFNAKPLVGHKEFRGTAVMEIVEHADGDTFRGVYTARFEGYIFVLHCFQKKSKAGRATTQQDVELIKKRFAAAKAEWERLKKP